MTKTESEIPYGSTTLIWSRRWKMHRVMKNTCQTNPSTNDTTMSTQGKDKILQNNSLTRCKNTMSIESWVISVKVKTLSTSWTCTATHLLTIRSDHLGTSGILHQSLLEQGATERCKGTWEEQLTEGKQEACHQLYGQVRQCGTVENLPIRTQGTVQECRESTNGYLWYRAAVSRIPQYFPGYCPSMLNISQ